MNPSKIIQIRRQLIRYSFAAISGMSLITVTSCDKDSGEKNSAGMGAFMSSFGLSDDSLIMYFPPETFSIDSKDPVSYKRTISGKDYDHLSNFNLKVQNGNGSSNKNVSLEILIDGNTVMTTADFAKGTNVVLKEVPGLKQGSLMEVKLDGPKGKSINLLIESSLDKDVIRDIDGNYYKTVKIGDDWYMAENLRVTRYNDGTEIPLADAEGAWQKLWVSDTAHYPGMDWMYAGHMEPGYCWYDNDIAYKEPYGAIYSYGVITYSSRNVCPEGWHVPDYNYLWKESSNWGGADMYANGTNNYDGGIYKEEGTTHWSSPNAVIMAETGFNALPGGTRDRDGAFHDLGEIGYLLTAQTENDHGEVFGYALWMFHENTDITYNFRDAGSIRCRKDQE